MWQVAPASTATGPWLARAAEPHATRSHTRVPQSHTQHGHRIKMTSTVFVVVLDSIYHIFLILVHVMLSVSTSSAGRSESPCDFRNNATMYSIRFHDQWTSDYLYIYIYIFHQIIVDSTRPTVVLAMYRCNHDFTNLRRSPLLFSPWIHTVQNHCSTQMPTN